VDARHFGRHDEGATVKVREALSDPHRAHHEGGDVVAHALLLGTSGLGPSWGLRCLGLGPLGGTGMRMRRFPLAMVLVLLVPRLGPAFVPLLGAMPVRRRASLELRRLMFWRMALVACLRARALRAFAAS
jgi:hypothetical protein